MTKTEFEAHLIDIVKIIRNPRTRSRYYDNGEPSYYDGYLRNLNEYRENEIHARGVYPKDLFAKIAPNQSDDEKEYIESTYQCTTESTFQNFATTVKRSFVNGSVEWKKDGTGNDETLENFKYYLHHDIPQYNSLQFFMNNLTDEKLMDSNGICGVIPVFETSEDDDGKSIVIDNVNPKPVIYHTDRVLYNENGEYIVLDYEKSIVTVDNKQVREGLVFILFTGLEIIWARQYGKKDDYLFKLEEWEHGVGFTPAVRLSGDPLLVNGKLSFTSPFSAAVPNLNLATLDSVNMLIIKRKVGYPTRVFIAETCQYQVNGSTCSSGTIRVADGTSDPYNIKCPGCQGTGKVGVFGPQSELMINAATSQDDPQIKASDAMAYVSPSVDIPKFLREEIKSYIDKAEEVLHLKAEPRRSGDISATEKNQDAKNTEAFIKPISDQLWYIYGYLIKAIGYMKYDDDVFDSIEPTIIRAERFDLVQPEDLMLQIGEAIKAGLPQLAVNKLVYEFLRASSYEETFSVDAFGLLEQADPLLTLSPDQIAIGLSRGTIQKWEVILHQKGLYFIMKKYRESKAFFELDIDKQIEEIQELAKNDVNDNISDLIPVE